MSLWLGVFNTYPVGRTSAPQWPSSAPASAPSLIGKPLACGGLGVPAGEACTGRRAHPGLSHLPSGAAQLVCQPLVARGCLRSTLACPFACTLWP
eukprot:13128318-Alexandrium_andersonii.AAC.1